MKALYAQQFGRALRPAALTTAAIAKSRLHYICALDRAKFDGRQRIANLYSNGYRIVFDMPLAILADEELILDYAITENGVEGIAIIHRNFP